jgi:hypothetical protein
MRAMSVDVENREHMDQVIEKLFSDDKFMEYYKKWETFITGPADRGFWDEQYQEEQRTSYLNAKQYK